jgi:hypothetical protein
MNRCLLIALLSIGFGLPSLQAQATDSVATWTATLQTGTVIQRGVAIERLSNLPAGMLPSATRSVMIAELNRLNGQRMRKEWNDAPEGTVDYYMSLVGAVAGVETPEAFRALIPAVGIGPGVGESVARLGDDAIPALQDMIAREFEKDAALSTLGLVWYWADSTASPLTAAGGAAIIASFERAYESSDLITLLGLKTGLRNTGDPAMLALAQALLAKTQAAGGIQIYIARAVPDVITALESRERTFTTPQLAARALRNIRFVCAAPGAGPRQGVCESLTNTMSESVKQIDAGQATPAKNGLANVIRIADRARADGVLNDAEYALTGGAAQRVLGRLQ